MWQLSKLDTLIEGNDKLNDVEQQVLDTCPALRRVSTAQKPVAIQGMVNKSHNPDFILLDSIWVECKGFIRDPLYRPMLAQFPDWLKRRYHVLICNSSMKESLKMQKFCDKKGISNSIGPRVPGYLVVRAIELGPMTQDSSVIWIP